MEIVNLGFDGKNYLRIQYNMDNVPKNTVNRKLWSYMQAVNN